MRTAAEAAAFAREYANDDSHGYDQNRQDPDTDCSQFVAKCYDLDESMWTGNEHDVLSAAGFSWSGSFSGDYAGYPCGAVFWKSGHTAIDCDGAIAEARIDATGGYINCEDGDQNGEEILVHDYDSYQSAWTDVAIPPDSGSSTSATVTYAVQTVEDGWLEDVTGYNNDDENGYAGVDGHWINGFRASTDAGQLDYRGHILGGDWIPDHVSDGADMVAPDGQFFDYIRCYLHANDGAQCIYYRVRAATDSQGGHAGDDYFPWHKDATVDEFGNDYCGCVGDAIDRVQMYID
jgi:hypothetical protein